MRNVLKGRAREQCERAARITDAHNIYFAKLGLHLTLLCLEAL